MRTKIGPNVGEIDNLPGSSQVAVFHSAFTHTAFRGHGYGAEGHVHRLGVAKDTLGYDYALCTVDKANTAQVALLIKHGWYRLDSFISTKTGHEVALYGRSLT